MKEILTESQYNHLSDHVRAYYDKVRQYKDGFLPEWKTTVIPGHHDDVGHEMRTVYRLKNPIPSSTGSEFGSTHWFNTLLARHKHMGEFLSDKTPDEEILRAWGVDLEKTSNELLAWRFLTDDKIENKLIDNRTPYAYQDEMINSIAANIVRYQPTHEELVSQLSHHLTSYRWHIIDKAFQIARTAVEEANQANDI